MRSDADIMELVRSAFSDCRKPAHFTNRECCEECRDHDDELRPRDVETLAIEDVGNCGWDPLCQISAEGFAYFFPALARLVLAEPSRSFGWYGTQLLFHLTDDGQCGRFVPYFSRAQGEAVVALLVHARETRQKLVDSDGCGEELETAIQRWSPGK